MLYDAHSHAKEKDFKKYKNIPVIVNGLDPESNKEVLKFSEKYENVFAAIGFHPTRFSEYLEKEIYAEFEEIKNKKNKIVAVGEVGLDYKYSSKTERPVHKKYFSEILKLAKQINKPVIIHCRQAEGVVAKMLKNYNGKAVIHSYTGNPELIEDIKSKFYFSINTFIFKYPEVKKLVEIVPLSRILTETDFPYITDNPKTSIKKVIREIARIKKFSPEDVEEQIEKNFKRCFNQL